MLKFALAFLLTTLLPASIRSLKSLGGIKVDTSASPRSISARRVDGEGMSRVITRRSFGRSPAVMWRSDAPFWIISSSRERRSMLMPAFEC